MNGKIIIILAVILIVISSAGIFFTKQENQLVDQVSKEIPKINIKVLVLQDNVDRGNEILPENVKEESRSVDIDYAKDSYVIDKGVSYASGAIATRNLYKNDVLRYEDLNRSSVDSPELKPSEDSLAFSFPLFLREYNVIKDINRGSYVDVYFRYEIKPKRDKDEGIVSGDSSGRESGNLSKLIPMFNNKKVLGIKGHVANVNNKLPDNEVVATVSLDMHPDEVKSVYAIENLGRFYFFPSADKSRNPAFSTTSILAKDFIKELRGGEK